MPRRRQSNFEEVMDNHDDESSKGINRFTFEHFNPDEEEWEYYFQRFEIELSLHNITSEELCKNLLLSKIGAKPFKLLADHFRPALVNTQTYKDITNVLCSYYNEAYCTLGERVAFGRRYRHEDETVSQYVGVLRSLAGRCQFGASLDERLRDQLLLGINNKDWQKELLRQHTDVKCTLKEVENSALVLERADKTQKTITSTRTDEHIMHVGAQPRGTYYRQNQPVIILVRGQHCFRCGGNQHKPQERCPADGKTCHLCSGNNHISKVCLKHGRARIQNRRHANNVRTGSGGDTRSISSCSNFSEPTSVRAMKHGNKVMLDLLINDTAVDMLYDPGAAESVISKVVWQQIGSPALERTSNLVAYTGVHIETLGKAMVDVKAFGRRLSLPVIVVDYKDVPLFGLSWVLSFDLALPPGARVCTVTTDSKEQLDSQDVKKLVGKYPDVFSETLGTFTGEKAVITLSPDATPKVCKPRPIPYALRPAVEEEIKRLEHEGVLEKIDPAEKNIAWASPIVVVIKRNGKVRICGDFKSTINPYISCVQHPLPRFEDIMTKLQGGQEFTVLDLKDAYLQLEVAESSRDFLVIATPFGYFRYTRLAFGVRSAPGMFQGKIEQALTGLEGSAVFLDDCIITGRNREEHFHNLNRVLKRFQTLGIHIQESKCKFLKRSVTYLGHVIDSTGIHPTDKHLQAIKLMPAPSDVRDLRAFLGAINYYQRFIPNLQCIASPLHRLLKKGEPWNWTASDNGIYEQLKHILTSSDTLVHFDPNLSLIVDSDASDKGLGAVLSHQFPDGTIRPICFASRVLQPAEKKYSVIDKEALGIIYAVSKFYNYIYARHFILRTDHKPLTHILGENSDLPRITSDRLTRWAVILGAFDYEIRHNEGKNHAPADVLSRLPLKTKATQVGNDEFGKQVLQLRLEDLHISAKLLRERTAADLDIQNILQRLRNGWPEKKSLTADEHPFYDKREELHFEDGLLLWKGRIVVPRKLRHRVLGMLHEGHPGIVSMRSYARFHVWWPKMDSEIEQFVHNCRSCQTLKNKEPELPLFSWTVPQNPWSRIHIDYAGPYDGHYWLVVVDATTKWLEVFPTARLTAEKTISILEDIFSRMGLPKVIVSDNGPQFTSSTFKRYCSLNNIRHITTAPYHPRSNGLAERYVQTFKKRYGASKTDGNSLVRRLQTFLFKYRTTPHQTTGKTPAEMLYGRQLRCKLSILKPDVMANIDEALVRQKKNHDVHTKWREFQPGDAVWVKQKNDQFREGVIVSRTGPVSYVVEEEGRKYKRHADHLKRRHTN